MAEASCSGPSPFKRLVDHQSRDVSHHQDRLVDRAGVNGHAVRASCPSVPALLAVLAGIPKLTCSCVRCSPSDLALSTPRNRATIRSARSSTAGPPHPPPAP